MKLEDNIKKQLDARRIEPTASAWDRIEGKLEAEQGNKKNKIFFWMAVAASFIVGVFMTALIFNGGDSNTTNMIVNTPKSQQSSEEKTYVPVEPSIEVPEVEVVDLTQANRAVSTESALSRKQAVTKRKQSEEKIILDQMYKSQTRNAAEGIVQVQAEGPALEVKINEEKEMEVIASVEAEELLKDAQRDMITKGVFNKNSNRIDANALLLDVEAEVDPDTFKDKVFQTLKKQFDLAVEAVANKDN